MLQNSVHILRHALGLDAHGQGNPYRNHFVTGQGSADYAACCALVAQGFMRGHSGNVLTGGDPCFVVTDAGVAHARQGEKPTRSQRRYQRFLDADGGLSFGRWLKAQRAVR